MTTSGFKWSPPENDERLCNDLLWFVGYFYFLFQGKAEYPIIDSVIIDLHFLLDYCSKKFEPNARNLDEVDILDMVDLSVYSFRVLTEFNRIFVIYALPGHEGNEAFTEEVRRYYVFAKKILLINNEKKIYNKRVLMPRAIEKLVSLAKKINEEINEKPQERVLKPQNQTCLVVLLIGLIPCGAIFWTVFC